MALAESRITAQGQISVPAKIRKWLGLAPGSVIEWHDQDGEIVVKRAAKYTSADIHAHLFPSLIPSVPLEQFEDGIKKRIREKHEHH